MRGGVATLVTFLTPTAPPMQIRMHGVKTPILAFISNAVDTRALLSHNTGVLCVISSLSIIFRATSLCNSSLDAKMNTNPAVPPTGMRCCTSRCTLRTSARSCVAYFPLGVRRLRSIARGIAF